MLDFKRIVEKAVEDSMKSVLDHPDEQKRDYTDFMVTKDKIQQNRYLIFEIEDILARSLEIYHHELMMYLDDLKNKL